LDEAWGPRLASPLVNVESYVAADGRGELGVLLNFIPLPVAVKWRVLII
jgi:hypothetical protein